MSRLQPEKLTEEKKDPPLGVPPANNGTAPPPGTEVITEVTSKWRAPAPSPPVPEVETAAIEEPYQPHAELLPPEDVPDELTEWLEQFSDEHNLDANVVRLADPGHIRFKNPCRELQAFGRLAFRADTFIKDIQELAGSGGRFKVSLVDNSRSRFIPGGSWTGIIADPANLRDSREPARGYNSPQAGAEINAVAPPQSDNEFVKEFQRLQMDIMRDNLKKLADPNYARNTRAGEADDRPHKDVSEKQVIAEFLMSEPGVRSQVVKNLLSVAGVSTDPDGELNGWQRIALRAVENKDVMQVVMPFLGNILDLIKNLAPRRATTEPSAPTPTPPTVATNMLSPAPGAILSPPQPPNSPPPPSDDDDSEKVHYVALDALVANLKINAPISTEEAWLIAIRDNYPTEYKHALTVLQTLPLDAVIMLFSGFDDSYKEALQLPHAREWLTNLQQLARSSN
jgi:hypothetical protein